MISGPPTFCLNPLWLTSKIRVTLSVGAYIIIVMEQIGLVEGALKSGCLSILFDKAINFLRQKHLRYMSWLPRT